jgi:hypothetical protein
MAPRGPKIGTSIEDITIKLTLIAKDKHMAWVQMEGDIGAYTSIPLDQFIQLQARIKEGISAVYVPGDTK